MKKLGLAFILPALLLAFAVSSARAGSASDAAQAAAAKLLAQAHPQPNPATVRRVAQLKEIAKTALRSRSVAANPNAVTGTPGGPVTPFSSKGGLALYAGFSGVCFPSASTCNASSGDCFCEEFEGTSKTTGGLKNVLFALTFNADDCVGTGDQTTTNFFCCPMDGVVAFANNNLKNTAAAEVLGQWCAGDTGGNQVSGGMQLFGLTGMFANALGTGHFDGLFLSGTNNPLQEGINGTVQKKFF